MKEEKDFFKTCFNTVAGLEVKNESQAIAKEVVLSEIENLQQENKQLKDNWDELKEYIKETKLKEFEKSYGKRYEKTFTQAEIIVCNMILDKMQELEGSDSNEKRM